MPPGGSLLEQTGLSFRGKAATKCRQLGGYFLGV